MPSGSSGNSLGADLPPPGVIRSKKNRFCRVKRVHRGSSSILKVTFFGTPSISIYQYDDVDIDDKDANGDDDDDEKKGRVLLSAVWRPSAPSVTLSKLPARNHRSHRHRHRHRHHHRQHHPLHVSHRSIRHNCHMGHRHLLSSST